MVLHRASRLRIEWRLSKGAAEIACETWTRGAGFEVHLVKSGAVILLEEARSEGDVRRVHQGWRGDLETLGWTGIEPIR